MTIIRDRVHQDYFWRHFVARVIGLILVPAVIYLSFFWVHFAILTQSGSGDSFMSPAFQETLVGNEMLLRSQGEIKPSAGLEMIPNDVTDTQRSVIMTPSQSSTEKRKCFCIHIWRSIP